MTKRVGLILAVLLLLVLPACRTKLEDKQIEVTSGKTVIAVAARSEGDQPFAGLFEGKTAEELPYIPLGGEVRIRLGGDAPASATLIEMLLRPDGTRKYNPLSNQSSDVVFENGQAVFELVPNFNALLSSDSADYLPGATLRGFVLVCEWEDETREYVFALRSDALTNRQFEWDEPTPTP